jgi:hypothetical protein
VFRIEARGKGKKGTEKGEETKSCSPKEMFPQERTCLDVPKDVV